MKYTICILLYCTLFLVNNVNSLLGGTNVLLGDHPSHAVVVVNTVPFGGTIVNVNHVVTSARIVFTDQNLLRPVAQFAIRAGSITFLDGFATTVIAVFPHPEFDPWTFNDDIAVLRTAANFPFLPNLPTPAVAPAVYNERVISDGAGCVVVGFNAPVAGGIVNPTLQELTQPIFNRDTGCNGVDVHNGRVLETMICAGDLLATSGICDSTRGGGLYCFGNFTGIASSGTLCGQINQPGVYTQVRQHIPWITAQLTNSQIPPEGTTHPPGVSAGILSTVTSSLLICLAFLFTKL